MTSPDPGRGRLREILLRHAIRFGSFTLASGRASDLYVDVKSVFLDPEALDLIGAGLHEAWGRLDLPIDAVGGMTLGADPLVAAFVLRGHARGLRIPGFLVRKQPKEHGTSRWIEGADRLPAGSRALILEDVITTGGSSLRTAERCREQGLVPVAVLSVVDRCEGGRLAIENAGLAFGALFSRADLAG